MTDYPFNRALLAELGLTEDELGDSEYTAAMQGPHQGLVQAETTFDALSTRLSWTSVNSRNASDADLRIYRDRRAPPWIHVVDTSGDKLDIQLAGAQGDVVFGESQAEAFFSLSTGIARVGALLLGRDDGRLCIAPIPAANPLGDLDLTEVPPPPIGEWMAPGDDPWLWETLSAYLETGTSWTHATAVGIYGRARKVSLDESQRILAALLKGTVDVEADRPWRWARGLDDKQVGALHSLVAIALGRMENAYEELLHELQSESDTDEWMWLWRTLRLDREEFAAVARIIREHDQNWDLAGVDELDTACARLALALQVPEAEPEAELWRRVRLNDPGAWWVGLDD